MVVRADAPYFRYVVFCQYFFHLINLGRVHLIEQSIDIRYTFELK